MIFIIATNKTSFNETLYSPHDILLLRLEELDKLLNDFTNNILDGSFVTSLHDTNNSQIYQNSTLTFDLFIDAIGSVSVHDARARGILDLALALRGHLGGGHYDVVCIEKFGNFEFFCPLEAFPCPCQLAQHLPGYGIL